MLFLTPHWPAPKNVKALCTTRQGGISQKSYDGLNLATHTGDDLQAVAQNRAIVSNALNLKNDPLWLSQVHGTTVVDAASAKQNVEADASFTTQTETVCAVLTADCLPLLLCDEKGTCVAAIHAGWRGLLAGVIEATIEKMPVNPKDVLVWYGPALGPLSFEVGADVKDPFVQQNAQAEKAFRQISASKWLCDIYQLADLRLHQKGVTKIFGERLCTHQDSARFYSYRRDGVASGRMASLVSLSH